MDFEQIIQERAYFMWLASGCEHGNAHTHWLAAEAEVLVASMETVARVMADPEEARDERAFTKTKPKRRAASKAGSTGDVRARSLSAPPTKNARRRPQVQASSGARSIVPRTVHAKSS